VDLSVSPSKSQRSIVSDKTAAPVRAVGRSWSRRKKLLIFGLLLPLILVLGTWLVLRYLSWRGERFYLAGRSLVTALDGMAHAAKGRDAAAIEGFYSPSFSGRPLGLTRLRPVKVKDGITALRFTAAAGAQDRGAAVAEWRQYLAGFSSIDEVGLHLHWLDEWGSDELLATVRYELIGTPVGHSQAGIDRGHFKARFAVTPEGPRLREVWPLDGERLIGDKPQFTDVAATAGVGFVNRFYPRFLTDNLHYRLNLFGGSGISVADVDNDGFYDLFIPDGVDSKLFRNRGDGTFEDITARAGLAGLDGVSVGVFADYDNDGFKDFYVSRTFEANQLFHNDGHGVFTDVTARSGLGPDICTTVASWADYDNDGDLDLYVGRYLDPRKDIPPTFYARNGEPNQLYRNNGDGTFTNVTEQAGVGDRGLALGTVWGDYDNDGDADLFIANDFGRKTFYRNEGNGTFTDVTVGAGALAYGAGMNASFGDYDNDGRLDVYVTNIRSEHAWFAGYPTVGRHIANSWLQGTWRSDMGLYLQIMRQSGMGFPDVFRQMASGNNLLHNRGDGTFADVTAKAGAAPIGWFWGASFADFDNDGWQDIYAADGWMYNDKDTEAELDFFNAVVGHQDEYKTGKFFDLKYYGRRSWHGWERNRHLRNEGDGTFREIGRPAGTDLVLNSRGVAVADFWNRGVMDIAVEAYAGRHALLRNEVGQRRNWLEVELVGTRSNRDAVGARVTIKVGGKQQMREVVLGDGYASQNSLRLHFGLGNAGHVDEMTVQWPASHSVQRFQGVAGGRIVEVTEGGGLVEKHYGDRLHGD